MSWYENKKLMYIITVVLIVLILSALLYFDGKEKKCQKNKLNTKEQFTNHGKHQKDKENSKAFTEEWKCSAHQSSSKRLKACKKNPPGGVRHAKHQAKSQQKHVSNAMKAGRKTTPIARTRLVLADKQNRVKTAKAKTMRLTVRAYCPCRKCCKRWWRYRTPTYKQRRLQPGDLIFATDGTFTPGTWLYVPGYGKCQVLDKGTVNEVFFFLAEDGASIKKYYPKSHQRARVWGKQTLDVEILEDHNEK